MRIVWELDDDDVERVKELVKQHRSNPFVRHRIATNLARDKSRVTKARFWRSMTAALLTTQQRSGPESAVHRFLITRPYPLRFQLCRHEPSLSSFVTSVLTNHGGIRRTVTIGKELEKNLGFLEDGGWREVLSRCDQLAQRSTAGSEREAADFLADHLKGLGPKQSRNLLQDLGLTRYEIPVDSRITKWLNEFGFPVRLNATGLSDRHYYHFVMDGVQALCKAAGIKPCVLDAVLFSRVDGDAWTEEELE